MSIISSRFAGLFERPAAPVSPAQSPNGPIDLVDQIDQADVPATPGQAHLLDETAKPVSSSARSEAVAPPWRSPRRRLNFTVNVNVQAGLSYGHDPLTLSNPLGPVGSVGVATISPVDPVDPVDPVGSVVSAASAKGHHPCTGPVRTVPLAGEQVPVLPPATATVNGQPVNLPRIIVRLLFMATVLGLAVVLVVVFGWTTPTVIGLLGAAGVLALNLLRGLGA